MEKIYYDPNGRKSFNIWVKNFALNLNDIWNEPSAKTLVPKDRNETSSIVIGRGPSLKAHNHLEKLANSNFSGTIICSDGILKNALESGVTPERFPNFYVLTIDPGDRIHRFFEDPIISKFGKKIKGIFSTIVDPKTLESARKSGIHISWLHSLVDYSEGKKSFNSISSLMTRAKNHVEGLPAIQTGGNVGTAAWFVSWQLLKCSKVCLIGIDHGWSENDSWDTIQSHGNAFDKIELDEESPLFEKLFPTITNPFFNCNCILDPIFQYYRNAFLEFIERSPEWVTTINATEGGSIFGNRITCIRFEEFLKNL